MAHNICSLFLIIVYFTLKITQARLKSPFVSQIKFKIEVLPNHINFHISKKEDKRKTLE